MQYTLDRETSAISYYASAINPEGKIAQLLVKREGRAVTQEWTGVVYKSQRAAVADLARVNGNG